VDIVDFDMNANDAVNKPKFHHQWFPDVVYVEKNFPQTTVDALIKMGYTIEVIDAIGRTELIKILPNGTLDAAADSRGNDSLAGW
jgi:gamma-glutamyltranspeptidase/glutathione hydrolase